MFTMMNVKHNWRTQDRDIWEYTDCITTHLHVTILPTLHFLIIAAFFLLNSFISHMILCNPSLQRPIGRWVHAAPYDWELTATHQVGSGITDWPPAQMHHNVISPLFYHHQAAGFRRSLSRGLRSLGVPLFFQQQTLTHTHDLFLSFSHTSFILHWSW